jgi:cardiolipin synthase
MTYSLLNPSTLLLVVHLCVVLAVSFRVIMQRPAPGVALAWLFLVAGVPILGGLAYLVLGERRISGKRTRRIARLRMDADKLARAAIDEGLTEVNWAGHPEAAAAMNRLGLTLTGVPTVHGCGGKLYSSTREVLEKIAEDVRGASKSVLMEFYIWNEGGAADDVLEAVIDAARRGVVCRILVDHVGAAPWWKGSQPRRLREAGVHVQQALPVSLFYAMVSRNDLRLHRKIVVIDGEIAWTGSMNMVDPRFFKQEANVGEWVDAMVRTEGSVVAPLAMTMIGDWMVETGEPIESIIESAQLKLVHPQGPADVQVIPTGPGQGEDGILQMLLAIINAARKELVLTTPYFVPDESMLRALRGAAARGVRVDLVVPEKLDSRPTHHASRSYYDALLDAGVRIHLYNKGLLHTKAITADREISMFGTVNLDMRSIWINYEVALFIYGPLFGNMLHALQESYIGDSILLDPGEWRRRSGGQRFQENVFRLLSPLL